MTHSSGNEPVSQLSFDPNLSTAITTLWDTVFESTLPALPTVLSEHTRLVELYNVLLQIREFTIAIAIGDLSPQLSLKGYLAGALKSLQANLRHLTWQAQQIADGDFTQRVDFMGDFSAAFNSMVTRLDDARAQLIEDDAEMKRRNSALEEEITLRRQLEAAEHEQRQLAMTLQAVTRELSSTLDLEKIYNVVIDQLARVVPHDNCQLLLLDGDVASAVRHTGFQPVSDEASPPLSYPIAGTQPLRDLLGTRQTQIISLLDTDLPWVASLADTDTHSWLGALIIAHNEVLGFITLGYHVAGFYETKHGRWLTAFANQAALAISNARLFMDVQRLATTDSLTELFNRRHFMAQAEIEYVRAQRYNHALSVIMMDIDYFKHVNDTRGHATGDRVLHEIADRCRQQSRTVDALGRYGGEEFVMLLPVTDLAGAQLVAERLRQFIAENPVKLEGGDLAITVSLGVSTLTAGCCADLPSKTTLDMLIDQADQALYASKRAGRNRVTTWAEMTKEQSAER